MPLYDYKCTKCTYELEDIKKHIFDNTSIHTCPLCNSTMRQMIRPQIFSFKGSGWAKDGYSSTKKTTKND